MQRLLAVGSLAVLMIFVAETAQAQEEEVLSNMDIVLLTEVGLPASVIIAKIEATISDFDTSVEQLVFLSNADVNPAVIMAMMNAVKSARAQPKEKDTAPKNAASAPGSSSGAAQAENGTDDDSTTRENGYVRLYAGPVYSRMMDGSWDANAEYSAIATHKIKTFKKKNHTSAALGNVGLGATPMKNSALWGLVEIDVTTLGGAGTSMQNNPEMPPGMPATDGSNFSPHPFDNPKSSVQVKAALVFDEMWKINWIGGIGLQ